VVAVSSLHYIYKPAWSPDYLLGLPYFNHLTVYRRSLLNAIGGFREEYELAQDWDLALRATACTDHIHHLPYALYRWRRNPESAGARPDANDWRRRCHRDHVERRFGAESVQDESWHHYFGRARRPVRGEPLVSVIIPTMGQKQRIGGRLEVLVMNCIRSILARTEYSNFEISCILDPRTPDSVRDLVGSLDDPRVRVVAAETRFSFTDRVNLGADHARGEHLLLLNDDTEIIDGAWMTTMLELSQEPDIGVVGAKLLFPDGAIENCGVALYRGLPLCPFRGYPGDHPGHLFNLLVDRDYLAVSGACQMTRASVFEEIGGYSLAFPVNYGDVDYCLRARAHGYRVVCTPRTQLLHLETASRARAGRKEEHEAWLDRWGSTNDPFWNPAAEIAQSYFTKLPEFVTV
jgi:GT2 family glycosyltransferase